MHRKLTTLTFFAGLIFLYPLIYFFGGGMVNALLLIIIAFFLFTNIPKRFATFVIIISIIICALSLVSNLKDLAEKIGTFIYLTAIFAIIILLIEARFKERPWEFVKIYQVKSGQKSFFISILAAIFISVLLFLIIAGIVAQATTIYLKHETFVSEKMSEKSNKNREAEILNDEVSITQVFTSKENNLSEISFLFADAIKYNHKGLIFLEIRGINSDKTIRSSSINGRLVKNGRNYATTFVFKPIADSKSKEYSFTLWTKDFPIEKTANENDLRVLFEREKSESKYYIYTNPQNNSIINRHKIIIFEQYNHRIASYMYLKFSHIIQNKTISLQEKVLSLFGY